jgi:hypothetical protein
MVLNIEISDVLSITQTIGIIGTLLLALYFSRRQIKDLSVDTETNESFNDSFLKHFIYSDTDCVGANV